MTTRFTARQKQMVQDFMADYGPADVRDRKFADEQKPRLRQLRTKKNNHLAVIWDELGNAWTLKKNGQRVQLTQKEFFA